MENLDRNTNETDKQMKKVIIGMLLIGAGILLILLNLGILPNYFRHIFFSWPMLLIVIGLVNIAGKENWTVGTVLITVGGFFLLPRIFPFDFDFTDLFWPAILVTIGLLMILKRGFKHDWHQKKTSNIDSGFIDETNVFGGSKKQITTSEFKGGKIVNIFGGSEIDLTHTKLAPGRNILEITCVFGGVAIFVPNDWVVHSEVTAVMGGFSDKRRVIQDINSDCELIIKGEAIFGGGEIKS